MDNEPTKSPHSTGSNGIKSALRGGENTNISNDRLDRHGNVIQKGGVHHMSFVDEQKPGKNIVEVREVQAYKNRRQPCAPCMIL
mmetsp:Transcript_50500/g.117264  ORF Transcript_50500/g.117264 Transcript_50500/m.117264 type:complete len:84 (-) Transcript_50500:323-574(-)